VEVLGSLGVRAESAAERDPTSADLAVQCHFAAPEVGDSKTPEVS
jgi:hypothetical protein